MHTDIETCSILEFDFESEPPTHDTVTLVILPETAPEIRRYLSPENFLGLGENVLKILLKTC